MSDEDRRNDARGNDGGPSEEPDVTWTPAEAAALERLRAGAPPADLEDAVVRAVAGAGLIGSPALGAGGSARRGSPPPSRVPARRAWAWGGLALAACLAAVVAGLAISDRGAGRGPAEPGAVATPGAARWLLLLYEDAAYRAPATDAERDARVAEYRAWAADLAERGIVLAGEELAGPVESEMLDGRRDEIEVGPGAPSGPVGTVAGFFVIRAPDQAAAIAIARTTPHLAHGGTVVVRRIVEP